MESVLRHKFAPFKHEFLVDFGDTAETILRVSREKKAGLIALGNRNAFGGSQRECREPDCPPRFSECSR